MLYQRQVSITLAIASTALAWTPRAATTSPASEPANAAVSAIVSMPESDDRAIIQPIARYIGDGNYQLDGLSFPRAGWWNVALTVDSKFGADSVAFNVVLPAAANAAPPFVSAHSISRPVVAVLGDSTGTEITDFMVPRAILAASGSAVVVTVARNTGAIPLVPSALTTTPDLNFAAFDAAYPGGANYVIVPAIVDRENPVIAHWLRAQSARGATIVSICDGAWTVANAGLFEGSRATGHWASLRGLEKKYPGTTWIRDRRYVIEDRTISTTGVSASLPASLMLVERIGGRVLADSMAALTGVRSWDPTHHTADYSASRFAYAHALWSAVAWWRHDAIAVPVADGVDEIALALTLDAIPRTMRGRAAVIPVGGPAIRGRQGLRFSIAGAPAARSAGMREIRLDPHAITSLGEFSAVIARLAEWYGESAVAMIDSGMEFPRRGNR